MIINNLGVIDMHFGRHALIKCRVRARGHISLIIEGESMEPRLLKNKPIFLYHL